jgi:hypothetical protein
MGDVLLEVSQRVPPRKVELGEKHRCLRRIAVRDFCKPVLLSQDKGRRARRLAERRAGKPE